ncbi:hypothetical protein TETLIM1_000169 [Candidatus Hodgkinia cicadicola]|nr:hypothetical protein TETLIM1_000169 [Candidatus Hodgkinia cicadicola]
MARLASKLKRHVRWIGAARRRWRNWCVKLRSYCLLKWCASACRAPTLTWKLGGKRSAHRRSPLPDCLRLNSTCIIWPQVRN